MLLNTGVIQKSLNFLLIAMNFCTHFCQQSCGKAMLVSVHRGSPHVTITHDALDLTVLRPLPQAPTWTSDMVLLPL